MRRAALTGTTTDSTPRSSPRGLAVDEGGEADARRRVAQRGDQRAGGDLHPAGLAGHHEDEVEADVGHAAAAPARTRSRRSPSARQSYSRSASARASAAIPRAQRRVAEQPQRGVGELARLVGDEQMAARLHVSEPLPAERRGDERPPRRERLDDLHADPGAGQDRHDDRVRRREERRHRRHEAVHGDAVAAVERAHRLRRVLADHVEARVGQRARARAATPPRRTSGSPGGWADSSSCR